MIGNGPFLKGEEQMKVSGALVVSFDFDDSEGSNTAIVAVGGTMPGVYCELINVFQGQEAADLYKKLVTPTEAMKNERL